MSQLRLAIATAAILTIGCSSSAKRSEDASASPSAASPGPSSSESSRKEDSSETASSTTSKPRTLKDAHYRQLQAKLAGERIESGRFVVLGRSHSASISLAGARAAARTAEDILNLDSAIAEVVKDYGDVIEISITTKPGNFHCARELVAAPTKEHWFVRKDSLQPILAEPVKVTWPDGTELSLAGGMRIHLEMSGDEVRQSAFLKFIGIENTIRYSPPIDGIGLSYQPGVPDLSKPPEKGIGSEQFAYVATVGSHTVEFRNYADLSPSDLYYYRAPCGAAVMKIERASSRDNKGGYGVLGSRRAKLSAGAKLFDGDAKLLGTLAEDWEIEEKMQAPLKENDHGLHCLAGAHAKIYHGQVCVKSPPGR